MPAPSADLQTDVSAPAPPRPAIAFQGLPGAYSHACCLAAYPDMAPLPQAAFEDVLAAVRDGKALYAMIPIDNSVAGRVADIHHLLPGSGLHIVAEHFLRVNHHLLVVPGATQADLRTVESHVHALSQCRRLIRDLGLTPVVTADTAGAARDVAARGDTTVAAIGSALSAEIYGLESLRANIEDEEHNTTRFVVMAREPVSPRADVESVTSFVFRVRNVPAALYKALGGFATNGVNMTKLESYQVGGTFVAAQFYAEVEGRPDDRPMAYALDELRFFSHEVSILGVYPAHPYRFEARRRALEAETRIWP
ncbi:prephenate dehydratase [Roseospira goensis]|uniref:prephenate dehydratase n=1 Tax=Roseospira goensis TaxID=391922 RepID=A0A7W6RZM0_9PROT|nr:prephenate dehydratase [Roseospira goensis]MBB4286175.1 prephenate dehydratase [Roseospira goensis]